MPGQDTKADAGPRFVVIGAGVAGLLAAIKLQEAGLTDFTVYEKADRLGGTWRENTYPGIACDVPSHLYTYSFAPNADWSQTYAPGEEILRYLSSIAAEHGVEKYVRYGIEVRRLKFSDADGRWNIETSDGESDEADIVIAATGVLHHPHLPDIPRLDTFKGVTFHSSQWNHDVELEERRVGVVGTGSSGVQIVGALADVVGELQLFQRTPQWIMPMDNRPFDEDDRARFRADPLLLTKMRAELSRKFFVNFSNAVVDAGSPQLELIEQMCLANLEDSVADPVLREQLRPDYRAACKRLVHSASFYEAIQRPNAVLVTGDIEGIEPAGIRTTDGKLHELDVLVFATGFRVDRFLRPMEVEGRGGITLDEVWGTHPWAYLSVSVPDFPNLFLINGPNGPVGNFSLIDVAEMQFGYLMQLIELVRAGKARHVSASREAAERFEGDRVEATKNTIWVTGCRSWYLDERGIPAAWPWSFDRFREVMAGPDLADYDLA
jgi:cation diffusion facilitator CzcD-associated flavoprotein CzcO